MSTYTGLYVQRDGTGTIHTVQAVDSAGGSYALDPLIYSNRGGTPDISRLPDLATYQLSEEFRRIGSQRELSSFAAKYSLAERSVDCSKNIYSGTVNGQPTELRERWWDPSSVYSVQRDEYEVVLVIGSLEVVRVRFTGGS